MQSCSPRQRSLINLCSPFLNLPVCFYVGSKGDYPFENIGNAMVSLLDEIQSSLFAAAKKGRDDKIVTVMNWADFVPALENNCLVLTPFCDIAEWEEKVKV